MSVNWQKRLLMRSLIASRFWISPLLARLGWIDRGVRRGGLSCCWPWPQDGEIFPNSSWEGLFTRPIKQHPPTAANEQRSPRLLLCPTTVSLIAPCLMILIARRDSLPTSRVSLYFRISYGPAPGGTRPRGEDRRSQRGGRIPHWPRRRVHCPDAAPVRMPRSDSKGARDGAGITAARHHPDGWYRRGDRELPRHHRGHGSREAQHEQQGRDERGGEEGGWAVEPWEVPASGREG